MKIKILLISVILIIVLISNACIKETNTEDLQPRIEILSPQACDTLYFDKTYTFKFKISDSEGLGNLAMDVHNNFNHHSHGSHKTCNMDEPKVPQNPYEEAWIFALPDDETYYTFETEISFPLMKNDKDKHDCGDYHFHIYVTNKEGYQTFTTLDFKLLQKQD